jgi:hypothetical protein
LCKFSRPSHAVVRCPSRPWRAQRCCAAPMGPEISDRGGNVSGSVVSESLPTTWDFSQKPKTLRLPWRGCPAGAAEAFECHAVSRILSKPLNPYQTHPDGAGPETGDHRSVPERLLLGSEWSQAAHPRIFPKGANVFLVRHCLEVTLSSYVDWRAHEGRGASKWALFRNPGRWSECPRVF